MAASLASWPLVPVPERLPLLDRGDMSDDTWPVLLRLPRGTAADVQLALENLAMIRRSLLSGFSEFAKMQQLIRLPGFHTRGWPEFAGIPMAYWLFKEEPSHYSYADLERDGRTVWDGVANNTALMHLRKVRKGDEILLYHTGNEKAIVAVMRADSDPYPDPQADDSKLVVVDVVPVRRLAKPITLQEIKADPTFADWELVRISRLSVMPVPTPLWKRILKMGGKSD